MKRHSHIAAAAFLLAGLPAVPGSAASRVRIDGKITGSDPMSGYAAFVGDGGYASRPRAYKVEQGNIVLMGADRALDWMPDPQSFEAAGWRRSTDGTARMWRAPLP